MIFSILVIVGLIICVGALAGKRNYKKISKRNGEITLVKIKSITGKKFTFEVHYGDVVKYEMWKIDTPRYNDLMQLVKD